MWFSLLMVSMILTLLGMAGVVIFLIQLYTIAFKTSVRVGFETLFVPFALAVFSRQHREECRVPRRGLTVSIGMLAVGVAIAIAKYEVDRRPLVGPTVIAEPTAWTEVGGSMSDTVSISGGAKPGGTVEFSLYAAEKGECAGPALFTSTKSVSDGGSYASDVYHPETAGSYRWLVSYSGDRKNAKVSLPCSKPVTVR